MMELDEKTFFEEIRKDRFLIVDFWADWCYPCKLQSEVLEKLDLDGDIEIAKLNVDQCPRIADKYDIEAIPTIIIFHKGMIMKRFVGLTGVGELKREIEYLRRILRQ